MVCKSNESASLPQNAHGSGCLQQLGEPLVRHHQNYNIKNKLEPQ